MNEWMNEWNSSFDVDMNQKQVEHRGYKRMITYQSYLQKWFILIIFGNMINCIIFSVLLQIAEAIDAVFHMISESILYSLCMVKSTNMQSCM